MGKVTENGVQIVAPPVGLQAIPDAASIENQGPSFAFKGQWIPGMDPLEIGPENYRTLKNMRYRGYGEAVGLEGIAGYSQINTNSPIWTEVDTASYFSVSGNNITVAALPENQAAYIYRDCGAAFFSSNFSHRFSFTVTSGTTGGSCFLWGMANRLAYLGDTWNLGVGWDNAYAMFGVSLYMQSTTTFQIELLGYGTGGSTGVFNVPINTPLYCEVIRDESVGTYGAVYLNIYTDSNYTTLYTGGALYFDCAIAKYDFRYLFAASAHYAAVPSGVISASATGANSFEDITISKINSLHQFKSESESVVFTATSSGIYENTTAIPSTGEFGSAPLFSDATGYITQRFSDAPGGAVIYCNGVENRAFHGNYANVAGFYTGTNVTIARNDIALNDNGASDDTIVSTAGDFFAAGFRAGQIFTISGAATAGNNVTAKIKTISANGLTITVATGTLAGTDAAGASTVTLTADTRYLTDVVDQTEKVRNASQSATNVCYLGDELDSNVKLMLHCDGTAGSTTFTDSSDSGRAVTATGNAKIAASPKFGTGSAYFDGTGDYLTTADSADWAFGANPFTIDFWFKFNSDSDNTRAFLNSWQSDTKRFLCELAGRDFIKFYAKSDTSTIDVSVFGPIPPENNGLCVKDRWYHCAIIRGWGGNANSWVVCLDGQPGAVITNSGTMPDLTSAFEIGRTTVYGTAGASFYYMNGYIDEFRVTKGVAKWTSAFTPLDRAYKDTANNSFMVLTPMPLDGVNISVGYPNATASTLSGWTWTGKTFEVLTLTDGTSASSKALAQSGTVAFTDTTSGASPFHFEGGYLYAYLFRLSAGFASIYKATASTGFNPLNDIWDGVNRQVVAFQKWVDADKTFQDYTIGVNIQESAVFVSGVSADLSAMTTSDYLEVIAEDRLSAFKITMIGGSSNVNAANMTIYYWNGASYVAVDGLHDGTIGDRNTIALSQSGLAAWDVPGEGEEVPVTKFGKTGFIYKIVFSAALSATVAIDTCYGVPAQKTIRPFRFPALFGSRVLLCGGDLVSDAARCDYCAPNAPNVWNGELSSNDGMQSLYFGGNTPLTGAAQLFNRFGSNIVSSLVMFKDTETYMLTGDSPENFQIFPISSSLGCPAPGTIAASESGYVMAEGLERNIILFCSYRGPIIFDGTVIKPLTGVEPYFDPTSATAVNMAYIGGSAGWYDSTYKEYNLVIPCGSSATGNNTWLVYDLQRQRWYQKEPTTYYPTCATPVIDANGARYVYAGTTIGQVMRLENGNTWNGSEMRATIETGDFLPSGSGSAWAKTLIRRFKFWGKKTTEAKKISVEHFSDTYDTSISYTGTDVSIAYDAGAGLYYIEQVAANWSTYGFTLTGHSIRIIGSTSNDGVYAIDTSVYGTGIVSKKIYLTGTMTVEAAGASITVVQVDFNSLLSSGTGRVIKYNSPANLSAWAHRFKFRFNSSATGPDFKPLGWGIQTRVDHEDV